MNSALKFQSSISSLPKMIMAKGMLAAALCLGTIVMCLAQDCTTSLYSGNKQVCVDPCIDADVAWDRQGEPAQGATLSNNVARCNLTGKELKTELVLHISSAAAFCPFMSTHVPQD
jgi:hypothetical protein